MPFDRGRVPDYSVANSGLQALLAAFGEQLTMTLFSDSRTNRRSQGRAMLNDCCHCQAEIGSGGQSLHDRLLGATRLRCCSSTMGPASGERAPTRSPSHRMDCIGAPSVCGFSREQFVNYLLPN
jgi:hypothetical protein